MRIPSRPELHALADTGGWAELARLHADLGTGGTGERADARFVADWLLRSEAPAEYAVPLLLRSYEEDPFLATGRWDVLSERHTWAEIDPHLRHPLLRHLTAHSRVLRGEDLSGAPGLDPALLSGVPFALQPWEAARWSPGSMSRFFRHGGRASSGWTGFPESSFGDPLPLPAPAAPLTETPVPDLVPKRTICAWPPPYSVRAPAWEAAAHACAHHPEDPTPPTTGVATDLSEIYPCLVTVLSGAAAHGGPNTSEVEGRLGVWRMLGRIGGLPEPFDVAAVNALAARLRCVGWHHPADEIWYLHLAVEDPARGTTWIIDGQDWD